MRSASITAGAIATIASQKMKLRRVITRENAAVIKPPFPIKERRFTNRRPIKTAVCKPPF
jgi:hypothetical protein